MKASKFFVLLIFLFTVSCANNNPVETANENTNADRKDATVVTAASILDSFTIGKVIDSIICKSYTSQSYALYIPVKGNKEALPVIYFFDPHAGVHFP